MKRISQKDLIHYEVASSRVAKYVWFGWGYRLMDKYFARKTIRKYRRYLYVIENRKG